MFNHALLVAESQADLAALARSLVLATTSLREKRQEKMESAEINCLIALMSYQKKNTDEEATFSKILSLLDRSDPNAILRSVWADSSDAGFQRAILGSLRMRLAQIVY